MQENFPDSAAMPLSQQPLYDTPLARQVWRDRLRHSETAQEYRSVKQFVARCAEFDVRQAFYAYAPVVVTSEPPHGL